MAWEVVWRVVSLPATDSSTKNARDLGVGEPLPVHLGLHEGRHQVVAGMLFAMGRKLGRELGQRPQRLAQHLHRLAVAEDLGVRDRHQQVGRRDDALAVLLGHSDHVGDRHQRQPLGDQLDEVAAPGRRGRPPRSAARSTRIPSSMRATWRGVNAADTSPRSLVWRGASIARNDCDASSSSGGASPNCVPLARAERPRVAGDAPDVLVADDRPVALAALAGEPEDVLRRLVLGDRSFAAQLGEVDVALLGGPPPEIEAPRSTSGESKPPRQPRSPLTLLRPIALRTSDRVAPVTSMPGRSAEEIPVAHTPPGGYRDEFPDPVLAGCSEELIPGAPDLRGTWEVVEVVADGDVVAGHPALGARAAGRAVR